MLLLFGGHAVKLCSPAPKSLKGGGKDLNAQHGCCPLPSGGLKCMYSICASPPGDRNAVVHG